MRADYATSDLINKVNSDWINEVLANRELGRADPGDDVSGDDDAAGDLRLRRESSREQTSPLRGDSTRVDRRAPGITVEPMARSSRQRSVARRVSERLALAVAALAMVWVAAWMAPEPQEVTDSVSARATNASPEPAAPINTNELRPAWLLPEILYGPAMARSPMSRAEVPRPAPKTGR
jgi:hypothetical protein